MKKPRIIFLFPLLGILNLNAESAGVVDSHDCQKAINAFLALPTKHTYAVLVSDGKSTCWPVIGSSNSNLILLAHSVEKGNQWAAEYLTENLRNLDGGNLEDSLIALGQFSDQNMERFLIFAKEGQLSEHEFTDALTMFPLSLGDDQYAQLNALKNRRNALIRVNQAALLAKKALAFKVIDDFISEIKATIHKSEK